MIKSVFKGLGSIFRFYEMPSYQVYNTPKINWSFSINDELSLASKQSLLAMTKGEINQLQRYSFLLSNTAKEFYKLADKNNPETLEWFNKLNNVRNQNRLCKKRIKQLARIAKELKMSMK